MTEFEMAYLQNDMLVALANGTQFFFTLLSAFLAASYVGAHRLTRPMVVVVIGLFVLTAFSSILAQFRQMESLAGLAEQIRAFAAAGKGLQWSAVTKIPAWWVESLRYIAAAVFLIAVIASVFFFFHCRRVNHKAEAGAWRPRA